MEDANQQSVSGIIIASDWDEDGVCTRVSVMAYDEMEYYIKANPQGGGIFQCIGQNATATGIVYTDEDDAVWINVTRLELEPNPEDISDPEPIPEPIPEPVAPSVDWAMDLTSE